MPRKRKDQPVSSTDRAKKHLPPDQWTEIDRQAFGAMFADGDLFDDDRPPGAHLSAGSRRHIVTGWRRWLGFLNRADSDALKISPVPRLTPDRMRAFVDHLSGEVRQTTIASVIDSLTQAARLMAPARDWSWLKSAERRILAAAEPINRLPRLVAPTDTLDLGLGLMETARAMPADPWKRRETTYRDGLVLLLMSLWPIRRRSLAALTVSRHIERQGATWRFHLMAEDTKARRAETFVLPERFAIHVTCYLEAIRPRLAGNRNHDAFWVADQGAPLTGEGLYQIVRKQTRAAFGKPMGLHDFRRAAATFIATEKPDRIGIVPGVLQHANAATASQHYNLANSAKASGRYLATISALKDGSAQAKSQYRDGGAGRSHDHCAAKAKSASTLGPDQQSLALRDPTMPAKDTTIGKQRLTPPKDSTNLLDLEGRKTS